MGEEPNQDEVVLAHFERVSSLAKCLRDVQAHIHSHEYDYHSFGTWKIVAGSYRHRFRFHWEGRKQLLTVSESFFAVLDNEAHWKELERVAIDTDKGEDPLRHIEQFF